MIVDIEILIDDEYDRKVDWVVKRAEFKLKCPYCGGIWETVLMENHLCIPEKCPDCGEILIDRDV